MSQNTPQTSIKLEDITFAEDDFQRKQFAENILKLISSAIPVSPLVIDGKWGSGKTFFCHKLKNLIKETNSGKYKVAYLDAYKVDNADDPLVPVLASIINLMPKDNRKELLKKALPIIKCVGKTLASAGIRHILRVNEEGEDKIIAEIKKGFENELSVQLTELIDNYSKIDENIELLKKSIEKITQGSCELIIIIDELDRCRPDFAVRMLECIKHIFEIEQVKFILALNYEQLLGAISHCYGQDVDAKKYLDKFLGYKITLPESTDIGMYKKQASIIHFENYAKKLNLSFGSDANEIIKELIKDKQLTLREVETFVKNIGVFKVLKQDVTDIAIMEILLIYLFCFHHNIFKEGELELEDIFKALGHDYGIKNSSEENKHIHSYIFFGLMNLVIIDEKKRNLPEYESIFEKNNYPTRELKPLYFRALRILQLMQT